ncbi:type II secretion system protein GspL [Variovorax sp. UMC13]|uniref:type II secretion system protein GspL n=1 Tax=Variovorax sp. UMC13 TaxID=1862326 RepID=UPI001602D418|nr:type II secretion system protein GspL [Variovorax sp. UMC13]MBB1604534.1 general secretion pathway protein GspL [Variovorax sp. UMC13]
MPLLIVTLPPPPAPTGGEYGWAMWSADGRKARGEGNALPALLPASDELVLALPAAALSWHQVTLPQGSLSSSSRLRAVLNGLLEDRLLEEPENLHFALEPSAATGKPVWVAACHKAWLRSAVQALEGAGHRVNRIVPEFTPQPAGAPPRLFATGQAENASLTLCDGQGVLSLPLAPAGVSALGNLPEDTIASAEPAVAELADELLAHRLPITKPAERWLEAAQSGWDLAQFDLASTGRARAGKKLGAIVQALWRGPQWRAARWGVLLLLVAQLVGVNAWAWKERRALDAKRGTVRSILAQTFPSVPIYEPQLQMSREVAALQQATGGVSPADLEPMLGALASSLPPGRVPTAVDYSGGQLRLRGLALGMAETSTLSATLASRGYSARSEGDLLLVQAEAQR